MKKVRSTGLPEDLKKALKLFPKIVKEKAKRSKERRRFVEKTFGALARKIHRQVHGKR